jgi:hypothetical protein
MVQDVKQVAARNKKLGKDLAQYITRLEGALDSFSKALGQWDQAWSGMMPQKSSKSGNSGGITTTTPSKRSTPWKQAKRPSLKFTTPGRLPPLPPLPSQSNNNNLSQSESQSEDLTLSLDNSWDEEGFTLI